MSRFLLFLLGTVSALGPASIDMGLPALPALENSFGIEHGQGALTLSIFLLGFGLSPVISGLLSDRYGRTRILLSSLVLFSTSSILCFYSSSFFWLLVFRLAQGCFAGASVALPIAIIRDQVSEAEAGDYIAKIAVIVGIAPMVAPAVGTAVLEVAGWREIFLVQGLLGLVLAILAKLVLANSVDVHGAKLAGFRALLMRGKTVFSTTGFFAPTLIYAALFSMMFSYLTGAPAIFIGEYGLGKYQLILILALTSMGMFLGSLLNSFLVRNKLAHPLVLIRIPCVFAVIVSLVLLGSVITGRPHYVLVAACCCLCIFMFGISAPSTNHQAIYALQSNKGLGSGLIRTSQMIIAGLSGSGVSFLALHLEALKAVAILMTLMSLLAFVTFVRWNQSSNTGELQSE